MRIYIAGPMTGLPDLNFPAFHAEAAKLRAAGHEVSNPAEINPDHSASWIECMARDIPELLKCEAIRLLPGWETSDGATVERIYAKRNGMRIFMPQEPVVQYPKTCRECDAIFEHTSECSMSGVV